MTLPRTINSMGGPWVDAIPVDNPETTQSAAQANRMAEDLAQLTRTAPRAIIQFLTRASPGTVTIVWGVSMMGVGSSQLPAVARTGTGAYTITYPSSWTDALGIVENIVFNDADASIMSTTTVGRVQAAVSGPVATVLVLSNIAGSDTPSDLTGGALVRVALT